MFAHTRNGHTRLYGLYGHTRLYSLVKSVYGSPSKHNHTHMQSPPFISLFHTCVCLHSPTLLWCDLAHEGLYLWEHLYSPGGEIVTRVSLFTVNSKSNKNKPHIICFMKLQNHIAGIHLQRLYSDRRNMPLGLTAINALSIYKDFLFFSHLLTFVLLFSFLHSCPWLERQFHLLWWSTENWK